MTEVKGVKIDGTSLLLGAALGAGVGAVCGWLLTRRSLEKRIAKEVAGVKSYYSDKAAARATSDGDHPVPPGPKPALGDLVPGAVHVIREGRPVSYGPVLGDEVPDEGADIDDEEGDIESPTVLRDTTVPYVIMAEEYTDENREFSKVALTWYTEDSVLADERDSPLRDISIAGDFQDKFGEESGDADIVFMRNEQLTLDMEITRKEGSFRQIVLGYGKP